MIQKRLQVNWHQVVNKFNILEMNFSFFSLNNKVNLDVNAKTNLDNMNRFVYYFFFKDYNFTLSLLYKKKSNLKT